MIPRKIEFDCGETKHKQQVVLEISHAQNVVDITIKKHAVSQRDDTQVIFGLSADNILKMADAIRSYQTTYK